MPTTPSQKARRLSKLTAKAADIRQFLVRSLSETGGHLSGNLGVVELTLALHTVFTTPRDKFVWDVGHQAYVHKILTGRRSQFKTLRKLDGLSGFPKMHESEHDAFGTGHSSTAISAALGLAAARDLRGSDEKVVAIVGDGSLTGGQSFEGLNNAGRANTDLLVVLNDNGMSIGKNVGALSRHLNDIRTAPSYLNAKKSTHRLLDNLPFAGSAISRVLEGAKDAVKYAFIKGVMFEELGFRYFGPVDGHDIEALVEVLHRIKKIRGPVLLHVLTQKGKGYPPAEKSPDDFHGVTAFDVTTGQPKNNGAQPTYTDVFSQHLCARAQADERIVAVTAAMPDGTGLAAFAQRFPKRFFDVGIAESHAVTFAAGLAAGGLKPVVAIYSSFLQRAYDQILHDVAIQKLPVVFAIDRAGIVGEDGETHQGLFDLSYLSHIPNLIVLAPANALELQLMLDFALAQDGPVAIRYPRGAAAQRMNVPFIKPGQAQTVTQGQGIALVSVGTMLETACEVRNRLQARTGQTPSVYNARFLSPIDTHLRERLKTYDRVYVLQDAISRGGYGEALRLPHVRDFAFPNQFIEAGTQQELLTRYGLDASSIFACIINETKQKETTP
ncbi:MAG: 1-deoxy-D-xylulose-5-phosphate synthase [Defluviitaleaceae bacterium]|nr:1-deoxy-D-xylulose-5-phosphate synthase [Defluviitaleaceae bacterium]